MSHFTVLVIGGDPEGQLAPFDEDIRVEPYVTYTPESAAAERASEIEKWERALADPEGFGAGYNLPYIEKEVLPKLKAATDEDYFKEKCEDAELDGDGNPTSTYNPRSKWDWYSLGGRWQGFFKVKEGLKGRKGAPGIMMAADTNPLSADQCLKGEVDWEAMREDALRERREAWKEYLKDLAKAEEDWAAGKVKDHVDDKTGEVTPAATIHERNKRFAYRHVGGIFGDEKVHATLEEYLAEPITFTTFAVLKDGVWYERGHMGWWAIVSDEKSEGEWDAEFQKMLDGLPDDTLLSVYDCHI